MADLTARFHDARLATEPPEWAQFCAASAAHALWSWPVVHALANVRHDPVLAATFHDADSVVGVCVGRLRGLARRRPWVTVADLECPGSSSLPGIMLTGGLPGLGLSADDLKLQAAAVEALELGLRRDFAHRVQLIWYRQTYQELLPAVSRGISLTYSGWPVAILRHGFDSWDDYLASLGRSRRASVRRVARNFDANADLDIRYERDVAPGLDLDAFLGLLLETTRRNHRRRWPPLRFLPTPVIHALIRDPRTRILTYRRPDGRLLGAGLLYEHPTHPVHGQWGAVEATGEQDLSGLWVDQMTRAMQRCIETGARGVIGGKGLTEMKSEFGFEPLPQWTVVRRLFHD